VKLAKRNDGDFSGFSRNRVAMVESLKMLCIWGNSIMGEFIHAFVEMCMEGNFDAFGNDIVPDDVLCSEWENPKEENFASIIDNKLAFQVGGPRLDN
jgi:hypothetical protein